MLYENLELHFKVPKSLQRNAKRVPRKFKKKWKHILSAERYKHLTLSQKLWYIQHLTNNNYNRFLIKQICSQQKN